MALLGEQIGTCRICMQETDSRRLLHPCRCKGTQAFVHQVCLETWLRQKNDRLCETCKYEYELEFWGMKPLKQWTFPRPLNDFWEDRADFFCGIAWVFISSRIFYTWLRDGIYMFHNQLLEVLGSNKMAGFWWLSFMINSIYYRAVVIDIFWRWFNENSIYKWKDCALPKTTRSSTSNTN